MQPLTFICWKWRRPVHYRSKFDANTVNVLRNMIERHYHADFELVCVTDDPVGIDSRIRIIKLWTDFGNVPSPHGSNYPSCYRRLKIFGPEAESMFGPRFVSIDLDVVICSDITQLFNHPFDFRMYGDTAIGTPYNGSIIQLKANARPQVYARFNPQTAGIMSKQKGYIGSDQGWIAVVLGPKEQKFTRKDGVYSYRNEIQPRGGHLPSDAKMVILHGAHDPWTPAMRAKHSWIAEHYR